MKKLFIGILVAGLLISGGLYLFRVANSQPGTQEDAIRQAKEYKPEGVCTQALVPAIHVTTGAKYTFNSGCLAPGWVAE